VEFSINGLQYLYLFYFLYITLPSQSKHRTCIPTLSLGLRTEGDAFPTLFISDGASAADLFVGRASQLLPTGRRRSPTAAGRTGPVPAWLDVCRRTTEEHHSSTLLWQDGARWRLPDFKTSFAPPSMMMMMMIVLLSSPHHVTFLGADPGFGFRGGGNLAQQ